MRYLKRRRILAFSLCGIVLTVVLVFAIIVQSGEATPTLQTVNMQVLEEGAGLTLADPSTGSAISQQAAEAAAEAEYPDNGSALESVLADCHAPELDTTCWVVSLDPADQFPASGVSGQEATYLVVLVDPTTAEVRTSFTGN